MSGSMNFNLFLWKYFTPTASKFKYNRVSSLHNQINLPMLIFNKKIFFLVENRYVIEGVHWGCVDLKGGETGWFVRMRESGARR